MTWLLDLDGVIWLADRNIPGASEAVRRLRARQRVGVVSNNSNATVADYLAKLNRHGVPTDREDLITSAQVAATLVHPGERVFVCAGPGVVEAVEGRDAKVVDQGTADAVIVGWTQSFDYDLLTRAANTVRRGARLIGTNDDATYPTPEGPIPGGGSLVAAVAYAAGVKATFAGKPFPPMVSAVRARFGSIDVMVGDRPSTDGLLAQKLGAKFGLVLSGVTGHRDMPVEPRPDIVADNLLALVEGNADRF